MSYEYVKNVNREYGNDLTGQALKFIDERSTDLRFDSDNTKKGKSISADQIP